MGANDTAATRQRIGVAIRRVYESAGLTQTELANKLNVRQNTISRWVTGERSAALDDLNAIDKACGYKAGQVLRVAGYVEPDDLAAVVRAEFDEEDAYGLLSYASHLRNEAKKRGRR